MTKPHRKTDARLTATAGNKADGETSVRQCAVTRERVAPAKLMRFALSPDGLVVPDIAEKLPGRGVWVTADRKTIDQAVKIGAFKRGFKCEANASPTLSDEVEALLVKRLQGLVGMAKKAGDITVGYDQVRDAIRKTAPGILLEAADGAEDGRGKVYFLAKALYSDVKIAGALTSAELGMALGRERVIHGFVRRGAIAKQFRTAYDKLAGFREAPERNWFPDQER